MVVSFVVAVFAAVMLALCLVMFIRNEKVYRYRKNLLEQVSDAAHDDINNGRYEAWQARYDAYSEVEYFDMALKFWKPLDSFYPDKAFATKGDFNA